MLFVCFFFSSRRRHTRWTGDWSSDVCSSDLLAVKVSGFRKKIIPVCSCHLVSTSASDDDARVPLKPRATENVVDILKIACRSEERRVGKECRARWLT